MKNETRINLNKFEIRVRKEWISVDDMFTTNKI